MFDLLFIPQHRAAQDYPGDIRINCFVFMIAL